MRYERTEYAVTFHIENKGDREALQGILERYEGNDVSAIYDMLDYFGYMGNAVFIPVMPEQIGALTESPMFTDSIDYDDSGNVTVVGNVFYYPTYEANNWLETLLQNGFVRFVKGA